MPADVGAGDDVGEPLLVEQLDDLGGPQHRHRDRRVVHRQQRPVLGRRRECSASQASWSSVELAVVVVGDAGVERENPQPGHVVGAVLAAVVVAVEHALRVRRALVVVAHDPDDLRAQVGGHRLDQLAQPGIPAGSALSARSPVNTSTSGLGSSRPSRSRASRSPASGSMTPYCFAPSASR